MIKKSFILAACCTATVLLSGCYTVRTHVVNKPRVDQEIPGESGTPVKTRKVVVMEVIEKDKKNPALAAEERKSPAVEASAQEGSGESNFTLPQGMQPVEIPTTAVAEPQIYVVEKDDTLQKISKKVYGSYSKWTKIYDANRDTIKDPNFLKSGITLKIPPLETPAATENK